MTKVIEVKNLVKSYQKNTVLKGIHMDVEKGEIFALLGVNGAGKTTALECIEGLRKYDSGEIKVSGSMGIQLQSSSLPNHIKPLEAMALFSRWNHSKMDDDLVETYSLKDIQDKHYHQLSIGQKRRLHLALALVGDPDIIFLDEPTAGLDVESRFTLHENIRELKARGKTLVLASHDMAEVESLCDRIAILRDGKIAFTGSTLELTHQLGERYVIHMQTSQGKKTMETDNIEDSLISLLNQLKEDDIKVYDIKVNRGTLEDHFIELARR